ncbi:mycothiol system anti-sigma-R factor [Cellulomonas shaoxiangyii]|uniref:Mycothiol system anti-sigma-R factor n=1 Tax=Cellulomonas shaoxiangyii TaxID=2566013 RepID=A0A4P7SIW6_9CELL|nr:mycothiol system anti-sigma-R factor [Cellulomonas shaoxiangyii]QCB94179.1 mycothiol system anti-sigma-R factor [Cellulomonas shaoxiangyii]TGY86672.1 mycothiol system anti-sigma-R factor [Cellulomonas shaoxiangyii]
MSAFEDERRGAPLPADPCASGDMRCSEAVARLWEYVDAEVDELDRDRIAAHLAECTPCLEEEQVEVVIKELVRRCCQEEAPATLRVRIHEQISVLRLREAAGPEA